jgi:hypothetical protein
MGSGRPGAVVGQRRRGPGVMGEARRPGLPTAAYRHWTGPCRLRLVRRVPVVSAPPGAGLPRSSAPSSRPGVQACRTAQPAWFQGLNHGPGWSRKRNQAAQPGVPRICSGPRRTGRKGSHAPHRHAACLSPKPSPAIPPPQRPARRRRRRRRRTSRARHCSGGPLLRPSVDDTRPPGAAPHPGVGPLNPTGPPPRHPRGMRDGRIPDESANDRQPASQPGGTGRRPHPVPPLPSPRARQDNSAVQ